MQQIVECVPNFSEGRRPEVYNAIADEIRGVPGAHVLDVSADPDHNRCVITFVGTPSAVEEAAFLAIAEAARHINLEEHEGEHHVCQRYKRAGRRKEEGFDGLRYDPQPHQGLIDKSVHP